MLPKEYAYMYSQVSIKSEIHEYQNQLFIPYNVPKD